LTQKRKNGTCMALTFGNLRQKKEEVKKGTVSMPPRGEWPVGKTRGGSRIGNLLGSEGDRATIRRKKSKGSLVMAN